MRDLLELRSRLERWALVAMFVTERPRSFYRFPLPNLTMLYRYYPLESLFPQHVGKTAPVLVADSDLWLELRLHCAAGPSDIDHVRRWGLGRRTELRNKGEAGTALRKEIKGLGITAGMSAQKWTGMPLVPEQRPPASTATTPPPGTATTGPSTGSGTDRAPS